MKRLILVLFLLLFSNQILTGNDKSDKNFHLVHPKLFPKIITVGGPDSDLSSFTSEAIQLAVDALNVHGGGTIKLMPGIFEIMAPIRLGDNISLVGSGPTTVLRKVDGVQTKFIVDADYGELKLTVEDPSGFREGMGVQVYDKIQMEECWNVTTAIITAIEENTLYINNYLVRDYHKDDEGIVSNACPVVSAISVDNIRIANLSVDGNRATNEFMNGCVGGGIYLHKVKNALVENCLVKDWNGDGISWQITENVTVRNNEIYGCSNFGMHPGTGSPGTLIEKNNSHHNDGDGLFVCWRVQNGIVKDNQLHHNKEYGISTGHKDSDMLYLNNHIYQNGNAGIILRSENESNAPHRSVFRENIIENNGRYGILIESPAADVLIEKNTIRDTGKGIQKTGILITEGALPPHLKENLFSGLSNGDIINEVEQ